MGPFPAVLRSLTIQVGRHKPCATDASAALLEIRRIRTDIEAAAKYARRPNEDQVTQAASKNPTRSPPVAPRRPHTFTCHGIPVTDDYAWLKDKNWQEV